MSCHAVRCAVKQATIICMTVDGDVVYKYKDDDLRTPRGLYCDSGENILMCDSLSRTVQVVIADGKKNHTLLSSDGGLQYPFSIAYRDSVDTLLVGCYMKDILIFQPTK